MADEHKREAARLLDLAGQPMHFDARAGTLVLAEAQVHATLHLAEQVERVAVMLDYIDGHLPR